MVNDLEKYHIRDSTHELWCRHQISRNFGYNYKMSCIPLSVTKTGKVKVVVFGERWIHDADIKKIRYVDKERIVLKKLKIDYLKFYNKGNDCGVKDGKLCGM